MASPPSARSRLRDARFLLWLLIVALAFLLRAAPIRGGLPYLRYIDEGHLLHNAITMLRLRTFDTGFYNYPSLPSYLIAGALVVYAPSYSATHEQSFWSDLQRGEESAYYDYFAPTDVIVVGRCVVLLFSIGIVLLTGFLGNAIGGARVGLLSLLFASICPALVSRGSILIVDTIATFFALASLCFTQRLWAQAQESDARLWRLVVAASVAAGFAFVSKYPSGAVFVALVVAILLLRRTLLQKLRLVFLSGFALVATCLVTMPALLTHYHGIFGTVRGVAGFYDKMKPGPGYFAAAIAPDELGLPFVLVSLVGIVFLFCSKLVPRSVVAGWILFGIVLLAALVRHPFQPFRNLLPLVPLLCVCAAFLLVRVDLFPIQPRAHQLIARWLAPAAALGLIFSLFLPTWKDVWRQSKLVDTRVHALNWLGKHSNAQDRILVLRELTIHPAEWKRIGRQPTMVSWVDANDLLAHESFDHIIDSQFDLRFADDTSRWSAVRDRWTTQTAAFAVEKGFGKTPCFIHPGIWRTNDERIVIRRETTR